MWRGTHRTGLILRLLRTDIASLAGRRTAELCGLRVAWCANQTQENST